MSREYSIQDRTKNRLSALNKRVSNKKSRYRREKGIELNPLIQTVKPSDFKSAKEVQAYIRQMERFVSRETQFVANEEGKVLNKKLVEKLFNKIDRVTKIQEREKAKIAEYMTKAQGKELGITVGERMKMAPAGIFPALAPLTKSLKRYSNDNELKEALEKFDKGYYRGSYLHRHNTQYKENFLQSLQTKFGGKSLQLQKAIRKMSLNEFMTVYYETMADIDIDYIYKDPEAEDKKIQTLHRTFGVPHINDELSEENKL